MDTSTGSVDYGARSLENEPTGDKNERQQEQGNGSQQHQVRPNQDAADNE